MTNCSTVVIVPAYEVGELELFHQMGPFVVTGTR